MPQSCVQRERAPPSLGLSRQTGLGTVPPHRSCALGNMVVEAFICDAVRTPIGRYNGALAHIRADDLAAIPLRALIERNAALDLSSIDDVILGCANQAGEDNRNVARMSALLAGMPVSCPDRKSTRLNSEERRVGTEGFTT